MRFSIYHICIILAIKLVALFTLWWYFFSMPISHHMTVKVDHMEQQLLDTKPKMNQSHHATIPHEISAKELRVNHERAR
jgi:hypothetical protein